MNKSKIMLKEKEFKEQLYKFRLNDYEKNVGIVEDFLNSNTEFARRCVEDKEKKDLKCMSDMMAVFQNAIKFEAEKEKNLARDNQRLWEENKEK